VKEEKADGRNTMKNIGARNNITTAYMFGELSPPLPTPVFVAAPALEGGFKLHLRTLSHNILRAEVKRRGLGRARSDDPPQRIEHLSGGASTLGEQPPDP
jgi:hypothetical protein